MNCITLPVRSSLACVLLGCCAACHLGVHEVHVCLTCLI